MLVALLLSGDAVVDEPVGPLLALFMPSKAESMLELNVDPPLDAIPGSALDPLATALNADPVGLAVVEPVVLELAAAAAAKAVW